MDFHRLSESISGYLMISINIYRCSMMFIGFLSDIYRFYVISYVCCIDIFRIDSDICFVPGFEMLLG